MAFNTESEHLSSVDISSIYLLNFSFASILSSGTLLKFIYPSNNLSQSLSITNCFGSLLNLALKLST